MKKWKYSLISYLTIFSLLGCLILSSFFFISEKHEIGSIFLITAFLIFCAKIICRERAQKIKSLKECSETFLRYNHLTNQELILIKETCPDCRQKIFNFLEIIHEDDEVDEKLKVV